MGDPTPPWMRSSTTLVIFAYATPAGQHWIQKGTSTKDAIARYSFISAAGQITIDPALLWHFSRIKEELATKKMMKLTRREFQVVQVVWVIRVFRLHRVERLSHVGFLFWMPQPHGRAIIGVGHEKMHNIADSPWQTCANKAWALRNPISVQAVNTTDWLDTLQPCISLKWYYMLEIKITNSLLAVLLQQHIEIKIITDYQCMCQLCCSYIL